VCIGIRNNPVGATVKQLTSCMRSLLAIFVSLLFFHSAFGQRNAAIKQDGKLNDPEWAAAEKFALAGGGSLHLVRSSSILHIALQGNEPGWAHVYFLSGDTVHVLHASAALGAVKYHKKGDTWFPLQSFKYTFRDTVYNDAVAAKQHEYLLRRGWVANNNNMGDGRTLEFKIDLSRWKTKTFQMAFVFLADSKKPQYFPNTLADDTLLEDLVYGNTPDSLDFEIKSWYIIK
jgi:hypothetical protein